MTEPTQSVESAELAEFREQWKAEVKIRTQAAASSSEASEKHADVVIPPNSHDGGLPSRPSRHTHPPSDLLPRTRAHHSEFKPFTSKALSSAVATYRLAIQSEQSGDLDEALRLYRSAFRLDPNVDKAFHREELRLRSEALEKVDNTVIKKKVASITEALAESLIDVKQQPLVQTDAFTGTLANLISSFPNELTFQAEDEAQRVPLRLFPDELLILVLKMLDPSSIERFAVINRKARVLSLDPTIWRHLVQKTYIPPQIPEGSQLDTLAEDYLCDYRRFFVEHPRLRLDGVYIAVCHYVRPGLSENRWVHISHLITYHRYLRFFPDGTVLSLLANDDVEPQSIIPLLRPSLRMKGLSIGSWSLDGTTVFITDLVDPSRSDSRYMFQMTLTLRSRPIGRWNKLDFDGYDSIDSKSGEALPVAMKHERPFWFSKVRSYV